MIMEKNPLIVTVMCFDQLPSGNYRFNVHYVAGFDSADAERRIIEHNADDLKSTARFINTDAYMEYYDRSYTRMYATRYTDEDSISEQEFRAWVRRSTRASTDDGEVYPAAYRSF